MCTIPIQNSNKNFRSKLTFLRKKIMYTHDKKTNDKMKILLFYYERESLIMNLRINNIFR